MCCCSTPEDTAQTWKNNGIKAFTVPFCFVFGKSAEAMIFFFRTKEVFGIHIATFVGIEIGVYRRCNRGVSFFIDGRKAAL
jgi:hypothetical protein